MSLSTYYLEYGRHLATPSSWSSWSCYAPTSNTASHDNHEKIHWWVSLDFHIWDAYGAPFGGPSGRRSSAKNRSVCENTVTGIWGSCKLPVMDSFSKQYWSRGIPGHAKLHLLSITCYRRAMHMCRHSTDRIRTQSPDCPVLINKSVTSRNFFLIFNVCCLCFQRAVLISAIFAGSGRKPGNASAVQNMPSTNARRPATFVLFQKVNYQHERKKNIIAEKAPN